MLRILSDKDLFGPEVASTHESTVGRREANGGDMLTRGTMPVTQFDRGLRVLCVDDAEQALALRARILEMKGYAVTTFTSAVQVAGMFKTGKFDVAVLDYEMPAMNGTQLAERLKTIHPELKIILYTGATYVARQDRDFVDALVDKSDGIEELLATIETFTPKRNHKANGNRRGATARRV
jgi:CheY-like chemotaxis protein